VIKRISLLVAAALLVATMAVMTAGPVFAAKCPNGEQATNVGGGNKQCTQEGRNPKFSQTQTVKGSFSTKREPTNDCNRPGQTQKCPPGQF
jgi:hypothetical protein